MVHTLVTVEERIIGPRLTQKNTSPEDPLLTQEFEPRTGTFDLMHFVVGNAGPVEILINIIL